MKTTWVVYQCEFANENEEACGFNGESLDHSRDECHHPMTLLDAQLMAAAPDLLEALQNEHYSEFMGPNGCTAGPNCKACAAIAKAEGR